MAADNVVLNKAATMERCIKRVLEEYQGFEKEFLDNFTKQDSVILNLERLCQAAIDLAAHLVRINKNLRITRPQMPAILVCITQP